MTMKSKNTIRSYFKSNADYIRHFKRCSMLRYPILTMYVCNKGLCTIPPKSRLLLQDILSKFCQDVTAKYIKGQKEHGGLVTDRDCREELKAELLDAVVYFYANNINTNTKKHKTEKKGKPYAKRSGWK